MFGFFRRKPNTFDAITLPFKSCEDAFEYACKFMVCDLKPNVMLPCLVVDASVQFKTQFAIKNEIDGMQMAALRVPSTDGGFFALAKTIGPDGPRLQVGDLVAWKAVSFMEDVASKLKNTSDDIRFAWLGLIIGTLEPTYKHGQWVGKERFK